MTSTSKSSIQKVIKTINKKFDPNPYNGKKESVGITAEQIRLASEYLHNEQKSITRSAHGLLQAAHSMHKKGEIDSDIFNEIESFLHIIIQYRIF
jgi:hypothetical protein